MVTFPFFTSQHNEAISFSKESGYYDSEFYLAILGGGQNTIHFTLDGSEPTINDPIYNRKNQIYIDDATNHANVYATLTNTSTGFLVDQIHSYAQGTSYDIVPEYTIPDYAVDKCTVVRASLFDSNDHCLDSITGTYFVGFQDKNTYQDIYTVSIVTSPENLFHDEIGIYVTGNTFRQYLKNDLSKDTVSAVPWWWWNSNYSNRGFAWEREAHIAIFDDHQNPVLSEKCGIRIKGGGSRGKLPKSISCYARYIYEGSDDFQADIFNTDIYPHKIVLFSGGDDNDFKIKDYFTNVMVQDLNFATTDFIPCAMFLDGEYWGMYHITEDYNADFIRDHYNVDSNNIVMIKNGMGYDLAEGVDEDYTDYEEMLSFIKENDMSDMDNYDRACTLIDIDSYIDYYAAQIYMGRCGDWPGGNTALWKTREDEGSFYGDGRWRWMLFDVNSGGLNTDVLSHDTLAYVLASEYDYTFSSLYQNEEFRRKFAKRLLYIGKETFDPQKCNAFLNQYSQTLKEPLASSNMRFYMDPKYDEFEDTITDMKTFFANRYNVVWDFLVDNMGEDWLLENGIQK